MGLCGPSQQEVSIGNMESSFAQDLVNLTKQRAAGQASTISSISDALTNLAAGKTPQGFSPEILAQLQSGAITSVAGATTSARQAAANALAAQGGGAASALPSGIQGQIAGTIASNMGAEETKLLTDINLQNFATGRENYLSYISGLGKMAELQDPSRLASQATSAGGQAFDAAHTMSMESAQAAADIAGAATGIAEAGAGIYGAMKTPRVPRSLGPMPGPSVNALGMSGTYYPEVTTPDLGVGAGLDAFQIPNIGGQPLPPQ